MSRLQSMLDAADVQPSTNLVDRLASAPDFMRQDIANMIVAHEFSGEKQIDERFKRYLDDDIALQALRRAKEIPRGSNSCAGTCALFNDENIRIAMQITDQRTLRSSTTEQNRSDMS